MKQIEVNSNELATALIDDKGVMSDSIIENLFDDSNYVWERNEAMGFINGFPCLARYVDNKLNVRYVGNALPGTDILWARTVVERISGSTYDWVAEEHIGFYSVTLLDNETNEKISELQLISTFEFNDDQVEVRFYWNQKK